MPKRNNVPNCGPHVKYNKGFREDTIGREIDGFENSKSIRQGYFVLSAGKTFQSEDFYHGYKELEGEKYCFVIGGDGQLLALTNGEVRRENGEIKTDPDKDRVFTTAEPPRSFREFPEELWDERSDWLVQSFIRSSNRNGQDQLMTLYWGDFQDNEPRGGFNYSDDNDASNREIKYQPKGIEGFGRLKIASSKHGLPERPFISEDGNYYITRGIGASRFVINAQTGRVLNPGNHCVKIKNGEIFDRSFHGDWKPAESPTSFDDTYSLKETIVDFPAFVELSGGGVFTREPLTTTQE